MALAMPIFNLRAGQEVFSLITLHRLVILMKPPRVYQGRC